MLSLELPYFTNGFMRESKTLIKVRLWFYSVSYVHLVTVATLLLTIDFDSFDDPDIQMYQKIRFKLITAWFNLFTALYFPVCLYCDWRELREEHRTKHVEILNQLRYLCFTSILLPATALVRQFVVVWWKSIELFEEYQLFYQNALSIFGTKFVILFVIYEFGDILFWRVWNTRKELIAPPSIHLVVPFWTQHCMHTVSLIIVLTDLVLVRRERPKSSVLSIGILSCFLVAYIIVCTQSFLNEEYVYPGLKQFTGFKFPILVTYVFIENFFYYTSQWLIVDMVWGHTNVKKIF